MSLRTSSERAWMRERGYHRINYAGLNQHTLPLHPSLPLAVFLTAYIPGVKRTMAQPPPPAPVSLAPSPPASPVMWHTRSSAGWPAPRALSSWWFTPRSSCEMSWKDYCHTVDKQSHWPAAESSAASSWATRLPHGSHATSPQLVSLALQSSSG